MQKREERKKRGETEMHTGDWSQDRKIAARAQESWANAGLDEDMSGSTILTRTVAMILLRVETGTEKENHGAKRDEMEHLEVPCYDTFRGKSMSATRSLQSLGQDARGCCRMQDLIDGQRACF